MPVVSEQELPGDVKAVHFAETPIMSTYLLAFIVGEFDYVEVRRSASELRIGCRWVYLLQTERSGIFTAFRE
jgi:aminopeptidase N